MGSSGTEEVLETMGRVPRFAQLDLLVDKQTDYRIQDEKPAGTGGYWRYIFVPLANKLIFIFDSF